ncbi:MAG: GNAT family N-acetyltransferase [Bdellovibrionales bacterium]|nr:GNAT family N-acetyltransferase [Bdellovibrionales bacterium]
MQLTNDQSFLVKTVDKKSANNLERETAGYLIRPYCKEDREMWIKSVVDAEEKEFIKLLQMSREQQKSDKAYHMAVVQKNGDKIVATVMITEVLREQYQSAFLGLSSNQKQVGDQVVIESFAAAMDIGFNDLALHRLEMLHTTHTKISKQVLQTLGLRSEGIRKQCFLWEEKWIDAEVFAITKDEWSSKHVSALMNTTYQMR